MDSVPTSYIPSLTSDTDADSDDESITIFPFATLDFNHDSIFNSNISTPVLISVLFNSISEFESYEAILNSDNPFPGLTSDSDSISDDNYSNPDLISLLNSDSGVMSNSNNSVPDLMSVSDSDSDNDSPQAVIFSLRINFSNKKSRHNPAVIFNDVPDLAEVSDSDLESENSVDSDSSLDSGSVDLDDD